MGDILDKFVASSGVEILLIVAGALVLFIIFALIGR